MTVQWTFKKFVDGDTLRDPVTSDFFSQDAIEDSADALVRESIQNSLDAAPGPIRVRIRFIEDLGDSLARAAARYFRGLGSHVSARGNGLHGPPSLDRIERIICIEDFGTTGLTGDPDAGAPEEGVRNNFFTFFRAEGFTQKGADDRGKWGVGKTVFPRSSRINSYFGLTVQQGTTVPMLMGRCILKTHLADGERWHPDGYYGESSGRLVKAITDMPVIEHFRATFDLARTDEPGLSVVVPFADSEITITSILSACVRGYFVPILQGRLVVDVAGDGANDRWSLTEESLPSICGELGQRLDTRARRLVALGQWIRANADSERIELPPPPSDGRPTMEAVPLSDLQVERLRRRFTQREPVAIRQHVIIRPKGRPEEAGYVDAYLSAVGVDPAERIAPVFVREGVVVNNAGGRSIRGYTGLVLVEPGPLARLLGASENVAHTEWNKDRNGFKDSYFYAAGYLDFVKNGLAELMLRVLQSESERDEDLLRDVFSVSVDADPESDPTDEGPRRPEGRPDISPPGVGGPRKLNRFRIAKIAGGFSILPGDSGAPVPRRLRIRTAYDTRSGNPLRKYVSTDFNLGRGVLAVESAGSASIVTANENELVVAMDTADFRVHVAGFDTNRDLFVKVDVLEEGDCDGQ